MQLPVAPMGHEPMFAVDPKPGSDIDAGWPSSLQHAMGWRTADMSALTAIQLDPYAFADIPEEPKK